MLHTHSSADGRQARAGVGLVLLMASVISALAAILTHYQTCKT